MYATKAFEQEHEAMLRRSRPIRHQTLRNYLDLEAERKYQPGLHNVTITITDNATPGLLNWDVMVESQTMIRVQGAHWTD